VISKKVLIIFPCYNEEDSIGKLLMTAKKLNYPGFSFCLLPINDCSSDGTLIELTKNSKTYMDLANNLGIGAVVQLGIKYAQLNNFDYAIQVDGDGQHPIEEIEKLILESEASKCDICIGSRYLKHEGFQSTFARRFGINLINVLIKMLTGKTIHDSTSGFRMFNKKAINLFSNYYPDKYPEPESIVCALINGLTISEVSVVMKERQGGKSSIAGLRSVYYMVKVFLAIIFLKLSNSKNGINSIN